MTTFLLVTICIVAGWLFLTVWASCYLCKVSDELAQVLRGGASTARLAHNQEVAGLIPAPVTSPCGRRLNKRRHTLGKWLVRSRQLRRI